MSDTDSVTENSEEIKTLDDQYDELSSKIDDLFIGDLGITTIYDGFEKARVKNKLKRLNKDPLIKKTLELVDLLYQSKQFLRDWKDRPTGDSGTAKVMDYDASNIDMDAWGEELMTKIGEKVSTKVEEIIPEVIKDAVDQISQSKKFTIGINPGLTILENLKVSLKTRPTKFSKNPSLKHSQNISLKQSALYLQSIK